MANTEAEFTLDYLQLQDIDAVFQQAEQQAEMQELGARINLLRASAGKEVLVSEYERLKAQITAREVARKAKADAG